MSHAQVEAPQTAAQAKKTKQDRLVARNRQYLLSPKDFRERAIEPLIKETNKLVLLALALGTSAKGDTGADGKQDVMVSAIRKQFKDFLKLHVRRISKIANYHSTLYRIAGKRADKARSGETGKARVSIMHRSISTFRPEMYAFVREAAATNEALRGTLSCSTFDPNSPLQGYMSPTYAAQFILAYAAANRSFNKVNGQFIVPDVLMKKHMGEGVAKVLASYASNPKTAAKAKEFAGQLHFCKLQELIGFYRVKPAEGSPAEAEVKAVRKEESNWPVLEADFKALSQTREEAFDRYHTENPKPTKAKGLKGPRGPLNEDQKRARKIKREANAAANALGVEISLVPKVAKVPKAEASTEAVAAK